MEVWKKIAGFDDKYMVSSYGRIKAIAKTVMGGTGLRKVPEKILAQVLCRGYPYVGLKCKTGRKNFSVHRLVAFAFVPNPENKTEVNHKDGNKLNNAPANLEWVTHRENILHAADLNLLNKHPVIATKKITGEVVGEYKSVSEAAAQTGVAIRTITDACRGAKANKYRDLNFSYISRSTQSA